MIFSCLRELYRMRYGAPALSRGSTLCAVTSGITSGILRRGKEKGEKGENSALHRDIPPKNESVENSDSDGTSTAPPNSSSLSNYSSYIGNKIKATQNKLTSSFSSTFNMMRSKGTGAVVNEINDDTSCSSSSSNSGIISSSTPVDDNDLVVSDASDKVNIACVNHFTEASDFESSSPISSSIENNDDTSQDSEDVLKVMKSSSPSLTTSSTHGPQLTVDSQDDDALEDDDDDDLLDPCDSSDGLEGIVQDVILLGAPVSTKVTSNWIFPAHYMHIRALMVNVLNDCLFNKL